jgi:isopropanol dehydrogenase (NADP+)
MPRTMMAFVMKRVGEVGVVEKPVPRPRAQRCRGEDDGGDDLHVRHAHGRGAIGGRTCLTLGHEAVGVVAKFGSAVKGFREGDRVAVNAVTLCFQRETTSRNLSAFTGAGVFSSAARIHTVADFALWSGLNSP